MNDVLDAVFWVWITRIQPVPLLILLRKCCASAMALIIKSFLLSCKPPLLSQTTYQMSSFLPHLKTCSAVDRAIQSEHDRVVILRFGIDWDPDCRRMDELLSLITGNIKNFAVVYLVDITEVPDFNTMYELYDPCTVMFFFRNKHILVDLGTGKITQINWVFESKRELIDIVETVFRGARKGRGLVVSPKDYSSRSSNNNYMRNVMRSKL